MFIEDLYLSIAKRIKTDKKIIYIVNRGLLDGKAFLTDKDFDWILKNNSYDIDNVKSRYDIVFCLETMATLGVYNQYENNDVRFQSFQEAKDMNGRFLNIYQKYFKKVYYFEAEMDFEIKYDKILKKLLSIL